MSSRNGSFAILILAVLIIVGVNLFAMRDSSRQSTNIAVTHISEFQFISSRSTKDHPVFVSQKYHFEYTPIGNYSSSVGTPREPQVLSVGIFPDKDTTKSKGIELLVYPNSAHLSGQDITAFRTWCSQAGIYDNQSDNVSNVVVENMSLLKATQDDGIDSSSDYYYLISRDFIYVFIFSKGTSSATVQESLTPFHLIK